MTNLIDPNYLLVTLGLILIVIELLLGVATGFDLLLIGVTLIIGGILGLLFYSFSLALIATFVLSLAYIVVGRKFVRGKLAIQTKATNIDRLINQKGVVVKKITSQQPGQVKIEGEIWRAEADGEIGSGESVMIKSVSGVTLQVKREE